jgi:hypothetical protein
MAYAQRTEVPVDRSKAEIERTLTRYGATGFGYMTKADRAMVMFYAHERQIRFILPLPLREEFMTSPSGRRRTKGSASAALEQESRRRWRALSLAIKAKLEAVQTGITEFEQEFLAHIVLPDGRTVAETAIPAIEEAYRTRKPVALIPGW